MDIFSAQPFLPGDYPTKPEPLGRFLPLIPSGIAKKYLNESRIPTGAYVLDPFGVSSRFVKEIAQSGYRVLAAVNNPITRFLLEVAADPPTRTELQAALSELASSRKGDERLETHLQSLYSTKCPQCQSSIPAQAFIWERNGSFPTTRILKCNHCGNEGEFETTQEDQENLSRIITSASLHKARALERVAPLGDPDRMYVQEALEYYLPRAIYGLITLINKLEGLSIPPRVRRDLTALVLTACDESNTLWPHPNERPRPRQLVIPPRFREINIWMALERSVEIWASNESGIPVSIWPSEPSEDSSICIFEGPLRDLSKSLSQIPIQAVVSVLPRPSQAFWSLSALWAGWLWGREAGAPFKIVLRRQRYDGNWQSGALYAALKNLTPHLSINAPFFTLLPEPEPSFLSAALLAADSSGFNLQGIALRSPDDPVQIHWQRRTFSTIETNQVEIPLLTKGLTKYLKKRGEPVSYLHLHAFSLAYMAATRCLNWQVDAISKIHAQIQTALRNELFIKYGGTKNNMETGLWGIGNHSKMNPPLSDQVEIELVSYLASHPNATKNQIETAINLAFPGLFTPELELINHILTSYALQSDYGWNLRPEDNPKTRRVDLKNITDLLIALGTRFGYLVSSPTGKDQRITWEGNGLKTFTFHVIASAVIGNIFMEKPPPNVISCIVFPGGRAGLISYKLEKNPALNQSAAEWQFLKYRQIRLLSEEKDLTLQDWINKMGADPITQPEQMRLL